MAPLVLRDLAACYRCKRRGGELRAMRMLVAAGEHHSIYVERIFRDGFSDLSISGAWR